MAKTIVTFEGIWNYNNKTRMFWTEERKALWVDSFENGIAKVDPTAGSRVSDFAELVAGCFHEESNFAREVLRTFYCDPDTPFVGIRFEANGVTILVTKENADKDKIYAEWEAGMEANAEAYQREREAYMKTPEYRAERAKELKTQTRRKRVEADVIAVDEATELEFKNEEAKAIWEKSVELNSKDSYSYCTIKYAQRWAKYMQHLMKKHNKPLHLIASKASRVSDIEYITGFQYGAAVAMLSQIWKYGDELRKWHNKKCGHEDAEGVVNPAIVTIMVG